MCKTNLANSVISSEIMQQYISLVSLIVEFLLFIPFQGGTVEEGVGLMIIGYLIHLIMVPWRTFRADG